VNDTDRDARERLVRAEYQEVPGLKLTAAQASRFWHLGPADSELLLDTLVRQGVLIRTRDGHYMLLSGSHLA
jgi:hypothetical protein